MADLNLYKILIALLSLLKYRLNEDSENLEYDLFRKELLKPTKLTTLI